MTKLILALGVATLALAACSDAGTDNQTASAAPGASGAAARPVALPAGKQWSDVVTELPDGGIRMGNPDAPVKLVEYMSLTCPHCAEFAKGAYERIVNDYVQKGTVSFEIRNYVRDPIDMTMTLISRCAGPEAYFAMTEQALATQETVFERAQKLDQSALQQLQTAPPAEQFQGLARLLELDQFAKQRGIAEAQMKTCLADQSRFDKLVAMQRTANEDVRIPGTPAFLINGALLENAGTWEALEPKLKAAGA
jgi:protein-disulfide isomerase